MSGCKAKSFAAGAAGAMLLSLGVGVPAAFADDLPRDDGSDLAQTVAIGDTKMTESFNSSISNDDALKTPDTYEEGDQSDSPDGNDVASDVGSGIQSGAASDGSSEAPSVDEPVFEIDDTIEDGLYEISSDISGKLLDVSGGSAENGANAQVWDANTTPAQRWQVKRSGEHYTFTNVASGKVLDVANGSAQSGANVQQYQNNGTNAQLWDFVKGSDGRYYIRSCTGGGFLDVSGGSSNAGANVQIYEWNGTPAQMWRLIAIKRTIADGTYSFVSAVDGSQVLDVSGASWANGAAAQTYANNGTIAQCWNVTYDERTGYYEILSAASGLALDVANGSTSSGTKVQQYAINGTLAQKWSIIQNEDGSLTFVSAKSGLVLDVPGGNAVNGNQLQIYASNGTLAQHWFARAASASLSEGLYQIVSRLNADRVLDVSGASAAPNAQNQLWSKNSTLAQKWLIAKLDNGAYSIKNANSGLYLGDNEGSLYGFAAADTTQAHWVAFFSRSGGYGLMNVATGKVLDVSGANANAGGKVQLWSRNDTAAQGWAFAGCSVLDGGYYNIAFTNAGGKVLDVANASTSAGANVQLWDSNGTNAQKWLLVGNGDGTYSFVSACSGKYLDVRDGNAGAGTQIQQWDGNGTLAQKWKLSIGEKGGIVISSTLSNVVLGFKDGRVVLVDASDAAAQRWDAAATSVYGQPYHMANWHQRHIVDLAKSTPTPGAYLCSEWVAQVFSKDGQPYDWGDACDYFWSYCKSADINQLKVGMIIAVPSHPHTGPGSIWGHICIYIGDGRVMDNIGRIREMDLQEWLNYYGATHQPKWGWYENIALA